MPLVIVQVSGLWQYWQRHMQPAVHATTRTPGPIDRRAGGERMQEAHVAGRERRPDVGFRNVLAQVDAQLERALRLERRLVHAVWRSVIDVMLRGTCG